MLDAVPLLAVTAVMIGTFSYFLIKLQLEDIRKHWDERRCEFFVIPMAHMVPDGKDPNVDPSEFAVNNFQFCIKQIIQSSLQLAIAPMLKIFTAQVNLTGPIKESSNYLLSNAKSLLDPLNGLMNGMWGRFKSILFALLRGFIKMLSAFDRIFGVATASIFAGISTYKAIQNALRFVVLVVVIILTVLLVIVILLFFILIPVLPVILTVIGVISASVFGGMVGGMAEKFCVVPGTLVCVKGGWKAVEEIVPGQELADGAIVEGVLETKGAGKGLVVIDGVVLSTSHLLFEEKWKPAGEHSAARQYEGQPVDRLYCLNTSNRKWSVKGDSGWLLLRDWEELPQDTYNTMDGEWEAFIFKAINDPQSPHMKFPRPVYPGRGLFGPHTLVYEQSSGVIPMSAVKVGDFVKDAKGKFTEVLAIYDDISCTVPLTGPNASSWIWDSYLHLWTHPKHSADEKQMHGYSLITKSGTILINGSVGARDFTEIGIDRIHETYEFVLSLLV